jgi:hypothetical protein
MLHRLLNALLLALIVMAFSAPAMAQAKRKDKARVLDFEGDVIETQYLKPETMTIEAINRRRSKGFIKIRTDFIKEIIRSAEDL